MIEAVPEVSQAAPGVVMPAPSSRASMSPLPATTGVPAGRPVSARDVRQDRPNHLRAGMDRWQMPGLQIEQLE